MKGLSTEDHKTWMKESEHHTDKWKGNTCPWVGRVLLKYPTIQPSRINTIPIKTSWCVFIEVQQGTKGTLKPSNEWPHIAKTIL